MKRCIFKFLNKLKLFYFIGGLKKSSDEYLEPSCSISLIYIYCMTYLMSFCSYASRFWCGGLDRVLKKKYHQMS